MSVETNLPEIVEEQLPDELDELLMRARGLAWHEDARCSTAEDKSVFYHAEGERGADKISRDEAAREICRLCIVRFECIASSVQNRETYGFWGVSEDERSIALHHAKNAQQRRQLTDHEANRLAYDRLIETIE